MDSLYNIEGIMNKFLQLPVDTRRTIYEQVSLRLGIDDPKAIEKDIWCRNMNFLTDRLK